MFQFQFLFMSQFMFKFMFKVNNVVFRRIQEKALLAKETIRKERQRLNRLNTVYIYLTVLLLICLALFIVAFKVDQGLTARFTR